MSITHALQIGPAIDAAGRTAAILRAPPFPGARPKGQPLRRASASAAPRSAQEIVDICGALTSARVGGSFWRDPHDSVDPRHHPDCDPWAAIARADAIVAAPDDELALLAAAAGRHIVDHITSAPVDPEAMQARLIRALDAFDYFDPFDGRAIDVFAWIAILARWRGEIDANRTIARVAGIRRWKRRALGRMLWCDAPPRLSSSADISDLPAGKAIAIWPSRAPRGLIRNAASAGLAITRIEDGFVRSVGLGAHLVSPCSIVVDRTGIYYDPARPSDLERILADTDFPPALLRRADALLDMLVREGVTKYAAGPADRVVLPPAPRRILVPGQVEDDLSVRMGAAGVSGNLDLLRRVRLAEPHAWIGYRPHPDVSSGLRKGHVEPRDALRHADAVLTSGAMSDLLGQVDAVHVLTSLAGFEALLRGREVVTHGQPFYAGWGLTRDLAAPIPRRGRRLTLSELVAGTLILYPRYFDPETRLPCPPEILVRRHAAAPAPRRTLLHRLRGGQGQARLLGRRLAGALG